MCLRLIGETLMPILLPEPGQHAVLGSPTTSKLIILTIQIYDFVNKNSLMPIHYRQFYLAKLVNI
jgi:hypothetical protein